MSKPSFPIEEVARYPAPGNVAPGGFAFSPDDSVLLFLYSQEHTLRRQLFALDMKSGEQRLFLEPAGGTTEDNVSPEQALRRERQRQLTTGITQFEWSLAGSVLVPFPDGLYVTDAPDQPLRKLLDTVGDPALDPAFSPDGKWVSYVQDDELHIIPAQRGQPQQLTHGARQAGKTHGLAEFVAPEEMGRSHGYWWSPDSRWIAFEELDETHIPVYRIAHQGKDLTGAQAEEEHRYPFAGQPNAKTRLGVVPVAGGEPVWMDLGKFEYLARVNWLPEGTLTAQLEDRAQTRLN